MTAADVQAVLDARREEIVRQAIALTQRQLSAWFETYLEAWACRELAEHIARNLIAALPVILGEDGE